MSYGNREKGENNQSKSMVSIKYLVDNRMSYDHILLQTVFSLTIYRYPHKKESFWTKLYLFPIINYEKIEKQEEF